MRVVWPIILLVSVVCNLSAQEPEDVGDDMRYELLKMKGANYRFDRKTGLLEKWVEMPDGKWGLEKVPTISTGPRTVPGSTGSRTTPVIPDSLPPRGIPAPPHPINSEGMSSFERTPRPKRPIVLEGEDGKPIPDTLTPKDRVEAQSDITNYERKLSLSHNLRIEDKISGIILLKNIGDRRLKMLEVTLVVPVVGQEKPTEHHFLYVDKPGSIAPCQPESPAHLQTVDVPSPGGGIKSGLELKISYIKFAE